MFKKFLILISLVTLGVSNEGFIPLDANGTKNLTFKGDIVTATLNEGRYQWIFEDLKEVHRYKYHIYFIASDGLYEYNTKKDTQPYKIIRGKVLSIDSGLGMITVTTDAGVFSFNPDTKETVKVFNK